MFSSQHVFCPVNYCFTWTPGWYEWDSKEAHKAARKARDEAASLYKAQGRQVKKFSLAGQRITRGGIGSGRQRCQNFRLIHKHFS